MVLSEKSENDKYARQVRSSAGGAVFVGVSAAPANWFEVGRAYERFALAATALGVQTAFVNRRGQARPGCALRPRPQMPYSLRRPVADVIV